MTDSRAFPRTIIFRSQGHPNLRASHKNTLEFTRDKEITTRGTCILGVDTHIDRHDLPILHGEIQIRLQSGEFSDELTATANPLYHTEDPFIIRRSPKRQARTFAYSASKSAKDINRDLIEALKHKGAELEVEIKQISPTGISGGALYVVPLPPGGMDDLSRWGRHILSNVNCIASSYKVDRNSPGNHLLESATWLDIGGQNTDSPIEEALDRLRKGALIAIVLHDGLSAIAEAELQLIRGAIMEGVPVLPAPGSDPIMSVLAVSGMPVDHLLFDGHLPRSRQERKARLRQIYFRQATTALSEEGRRMLDILDDIDWAFGDRSICIAKELGGASEEIFHGLARGLPSMLNQRQALEGEFIILLPGSESDGDSDDARAGASDEFLAALIENGVPTAAIVSALRDAMGWSRNQAYQTVLQIKHSMDEDDD